MTDTWTPTSDLKTRPADTRAVAIAVAVSVALAWSTVSSDAAKLVFAPGMLFGVPYLRSVVVSLADVVVMIALVSVAAGRNPLETLPVTGLAAPVLKPLLWAGLVFAPAVIACLIVTQPAEGVAGADIAWQAVGAPFVEEVLYRGLAVGVLIRWCGWNWLAACLWPAVFFGLAHLWQGEDFAETAAVVGITAFGAVLFGWLFVRWGFNLWPPILLHIGMNMQWLVFDLGETAIGGVTGNVLRFGVIALAVGLTFWLTRGVQVRDGRTQ